MQHFFFSREASSFKKKKNLQVSSDMSAGEKLETDSCILDLSLPFSSTHSITKNKNYPLRRYDSLSQKK